MCTPSWWYPCGEHGGEKQSTATTAMSTRERNTSKAAARQNTALTYLDSPPLAPVAARLALLVIKPGPVGPLRWRLGLRLQRLRARPAHDVDTPADTHTDIYIHRLEGGTGGRCWWWRKRQAGDGRGDGAVPTAKRLTGSRSCYRSLLALRRTGPGAFSGQGGEHQCLVWVVGYFLLPCF